MSTDSLPQMYGHVFEPALQDISLKRFRLRYCSYNDCYYLHWDNPVCRALAKRYGLSEGLHASSGIQRHQEQGEDQLRYLSLSEGVSKASLEWVIDFSSCGLVIHQLALRSRCSYDNQASVSLCVRGDNSITLTPQFGDQHMDLNCLAGCSRVSIVMTIESAPNESVRLLPSFETDESPLDIIVDLMCPRKDDEIYAGELLLGIKYTSDRSPSDNESTNSLLSSEGVEGVGHLQVHVVEGAGIVDEDTHKPFNTLCKCDMLPSAGRHSTQHTSPKHNAYPTWTKQFDFEGLSRVDLVNGGLEVILYDHHKFSHDNNIGGLRMCVPRKKLLMKHLNSSLSANNSPLGSRGSSPALIENGDSPYHSDGSLSPILLSSNSLQSHNPSPRNSAFLPNHGRNSIPTSISLNAVSHTHLSPEITRRSQSPDVNTLSPNVIRRTSSGGRAAKNKFRLSGSHLMNLFTPNSSPRSSPIGRRKIFSRNNSIESEYVHWWMEDTPTTEVRHWQQVMDKDGEWVYFWHLIRPNLKSAN